MFEKVTLEMSLKPFRKTDKDYMKNKIEEMFNMWSILTKDAKTISVLLWVADGSEILDWHGDMTEEVEWGHYVGGASNLLDGGKNSKFDPEGVALHSRCYNYMDNPPVITYETIKEIILLIKEVGGKMFPDKKIEVGETFDPGPEFAISKFKYVNHNEICRGATMGKKSMVCCYSTLHADDVKYAGFPEGIEEGLPFATFFGRQAEFFLKAMGFDYLWLSNGFGFGMESWSATGAIFDGKDFDVSRFDEVKEKIVGFWKLFRKECSYPVETRGTNLSVGIDLATDGVPLKDIYEGKFNLLPPPNSPWAALDSNYGLEISGYLSRISSLPGKEYLFRYYVHDPWWNNTPWISRYESQPHDIYLPMSLSRLDEKGKVHLPTNLNILSVDNSFGEMPDFCAHEPSVHINRALRNAPDEAAPVIWVYPFDEYHTYRDKKKIMEMYFGDWFICGAINHGLPIGSVISTANFALADKKVFDGKVLISVVPDAGSKYESEILSFVKDGGKVIFYGNAADASEEFKCLAGIEISEDELYGELSVNAETFDKAADEVPKVINHRFLSCGGGVNAVLREDSNAEVLAEFGGRVGGTYNNNMVWVDGTCSAEYRGGHLVTPDDETKYFCGDSLMRKALDMLGIKIRFEKISTADKEPVMVISRHDGAYMFSVFSRDTTVKTKIKMPLGAPLIFGREVKLDSDGFAEYSFGLSEYAECRVFVEQEGGKVSLHEKAPAGFHCSRKFILSGLKNATVRFFAPHYCKNNFESLLNSDNVFTILSEEFEGGYKTDEFGTYFEAKNVSGTMFYKIPYKEAYASNDKPEGITPVFRD